MDDGVDRALVLCADLGPVLGQALKPIQASKQWVLLGAFASVASARSTGPAPGLKLLGSLSDLEGNKVWDRADYVLLVRSGGPQDAALSVAAHKTGDTVIPVEASATASTQAPSFAPH